MSEFSKSIARWLRERAALYDHPEDGGLPTVTTDNQTTATAAEVAEIQAGLTEIKGGVTTLLASLDALGARIVKLEPAPLPIPTTIDELFAEFDPTGSGVIRFSAVDKRNSERLYNAMQALGYDPYSGKALYREAPVQLLKVVGKKGEALHGGSGEWPLPSRGKPGKWMEVKDQIVMCSAGLHVISLKYVPEWTQRTYHSNERRVFIVEVEGPLLWDGSKFAVRKARLVKEIPYKSGLRDEATRGSLPDRIAALGGMAALYPEIESEKGKAALAKLKPEDVAKNLVKIGEDEMNELLAMSSEALAAFYREGTKTPVALEFQTRANELKSKSKRVADGLVYTYGSSASIATRIQHAEMKKGIYKAVPESEIEAKLFERLGLDPSLKWGDKPFEGWS